MYVAETLWEGGHGRGVSKPAVQGKPDLPVRVWLRVTRFIDSYTSPVKVFVSWIINHTTLDYLILQWLKGLCTLQNFYSTDLFHLGVHLYPLIGS